MYSFFHIQFPKINVFPLSFKYTAIYLHIHGEYPNIYIFMKNILNLINIYVFMENILNQYGLQWKSKNIIFHHTQRPLVQLHAYPQLPRQEKRSRKQRTFLPYTNSALSLILEKWQQNRELKFSQPKETFQNHLPPLSFSSLVSVPPTSLSFFFFHCS